MRLSVTPHVGVWIETPKSNTSNTHNRVTPHVGVWIETRNGFDLSSKRNVTPHVGVWIETYRHSEIIIWHQSHLM